MSTHDAPLCRCPHCGYRFNACTNAQRGSDNAPKPGDVTICIECERIGIYTDALSVRAPEPGEISGLDLPIIARALAALRLTKKEHPRNA